MAWKCVRDSVWFSTPDEMSVYRVHSLIHRRALDVVVHGEDTKATIARWCYDNIEQSGRLRNDVICAAGHVANGASFALSFGLFTLILSC